MEKRRITSKRRIKSQPEARRPKGLASGHGTVAMDSQHIVTHQVGAMPIINRVFERMNLHRLLQQHLPNEDKRCRVDTARMVMILIRNVLLSREPMYGVGEWSRTYAPDLFDLWPDQLDGLNDDRVGRCLDRLFETVATNRSSLIMDVVSHVVTEFDLRLDELHNDSTSVTLTGKYDDAKKEKQIGELEVPAITWGHNKDHRPDLKQLLYILTVTDDGGVPVYFHATSGNVADDQTHQQTWKLMAELVQRPDFVYVADCKLASAENMSEIARLGGRFITVLPSNRKENAAFRKQLMQPSSRSASNGSPQNADDPQPIEWQEILRLIDEFTNEHGEIVEKVRDVFQVCTPERISKEGYRLLWFHSLGKATNDAETRARHIERAERELEDLRRRVEGPRTRFRSKEKIESAAKEIVEARGVQDFLSIHIEESEHEEFHQTTRGRPTKNTKYKRTVVKRFRLTWQLGRRANRSGSCGRWRLSADHEHSRLVRRRNPGGLQTATNDRETILAIEERLPSRTGLPQERASNRRTAGRLLFRSDGPVAHRARTTKRHDSRRLAVSAALPRGTSVPSANNTASDRRI